MTKIDIFSGFLGAGKTTLIRKLIAEAYKGEKLVLIENEFGEIAVDGGFLQDAGVQITEMNSGCICCSLVGDFKEALQKVLAQYQPDRILIEPSGVGKLSDVAKAVERAEGDACIGARITVADAQKCKLYSKNFGEFYDDQVASADMIVLSRTDKLSAAQIEEAVAILRARNPEAVIVTTPWDQLSGAQLRDAADEKHNLAHDLHALEEEHEHHHHDHEDDDDDDDCCCGHHHDHEHEHHHHHDHGEACSCGHDHDDHDHDDDDDDCCCGHDHDHEHHHDHDHGEECSCGHEHHHHHDHDADEIFTSWGLETAHAFDGEHLTFLLSELDEGAFGLVLRAKGIVADQKGGWLHFDYVPGEVSVRKGPAAITGRLCVIGSKLDEEGLKKHFGLN